MGWFSSSHQQGQSAEMHRRSYIAALRDHWGSYRSRYVGRRYAVTGVPVPFTALVSRIDDKGQVLLSCASQWEQFTLLLFLQEFEAAIASGHFVAC